MAIRAPSELIKLWVEFSHIIWFDNIGGPQRGTESSKGDGSAIGQSGGGSIEPLQFSLLHRSIIIIAIVLLILEEAKSLEGSNQEVLLFLYRQEGALEGVVRLVGGLRFPFFLTELAILERPFPFPGRCCRL